MTPKEYMQFAQKTMDKMLEISKQKNADYTGDSNDPFSNFTRVEALGICSTEQGFLTRMTDKMCRITSFVNQGTLMVKDESVEDTLQDLANYCILFMGYLESEKKAAKQHYVDMDKRAELYASNFDYVLEKRGKKAALAYIAEELGVDLDKYENKEEK